MSSSCIWILTDPVQISECKNSLNELEEPLIMLTGRYKMNS